MKEKKLKKISAFTLAMDYLLSFLFILLICLNIKPKTTNKNNPELIELVEEEKVKVVKEEFVNVLNNPKTIIDTQVKYKDHLDGIILNDPEPIVAVVNNDPLYINRDITRIDKDVVIDDTHRIGVVEGGTGGNGHVGVDRRRLQGQRNRLKEDVYNKDVDLGLLDRRLAQEDLFRDKTDLAVDDIEEKFGLDKDGVNLANLTVAKNNDNAELGDVENFDIDFDDNKNEKFGINKGELYAYNFPSQGVGAGISNGAVGAGASASAGLSAGVGESVYNGEIVPTLGGVGDGAKTADGEPIQLVGAGGLVGGAGAGGAAGLSQGYITKKLGLGMGIGKGMGYGQGKAYNYDHLPKDGALHIMMHVDGSGSILNTRKQLDIMKDTILKTALLPYYNNDESLYNQRVTIVSSSGERTLRFFTEAASKDNVLAIAFQDEAQPAYHLPNFNKKPEDHYLDDIKKLKSSLNNYNGLYRGVMFQVDRGKTFAKSFKEFVGNAFKGEGYLKSNNLKEYHRDNNLNDIKNKNGIIFSDEYHAKDSGDPQYYLDLIINASKKIGLDLEVSKGGLSDGRYVKD